jgi:hypothetical protein
VHYGCDEAAGIAAPCLTTSDGAAAISANCAVIAARGERAASRQNISECVSTVGAQLQHAAIEADAWIDIRCFKIEVVPEC